jgi:hypothetical protein
MTNGDHGVSMEQVCEYLGEKEREAEDAGKIIEARTFYDAYSALWVAHPDIRDSLIVAYKRGYTSSMLK